MKTTRLCVLALLCGMAFGGEQPKPKKPLTIAIDAKKREVRVDAVVCLDAGMLEYMVCLQDTFEHETIFSTKCVPSHLHLGLLAIGLVPHPLTNDPVWWQQVRLKPKARVDIHVEFEQEGKTVRHPLAALMTSRGDKEAAVPDYWIFTGSTFFKHEGKSQYAADHSGIVIGIIPMGSSVVQYGELAADPYRGDNQGLEIDTEVCPPLGTKVKLVFSPHPEEQKGEKP